MDDNLAIAYLGALVGLLAILAGLVLRQILKSRQYESVIGKLQPKLQTAKGTPQEYYELGSIYLRKKIYARAIIEFQKALKAEGDVFPELYNALGYTYFSQEQYDLAIKHYRTALELQPTYGIAMNNLAHAYEKKKLIPQAIAQYEQVLQLEPANKTAQQRLSSLRKRIPSTAPTPTDKI
ncbi:MAG: tetratricopeptide repeat protein [Oscillatoriales cyanobacterium SM2_2_1]|nr:tetratricopeptide repeat protein [Oscillatoriales cyanobacterium SM2_2_1]